MIDLYGKQESLKGIGTMSHKDELRRKMSSMQGMVSDETRSKLQNSLQAEAAKKKIQNALDEKGGMNKDMLVGAIRKMMDS